MHFPSRRVTPTATAFTFLELLIAIAVLLALAALTVGLAGWAGRGTNDRKARVQLNLLQSKIDAYAADQGGMPSACDDSGLLIYRMLYGDGLGPDRIAGTADDDAPDGNPDPGAEVYLADLDPYSNPLRMTDSVGDPLEPRRLTDPFGFPWRFRSGKAAVTINPDYDLWSVGPDGRSGTADDIRNW